MPYSLVFKYVSKDYNYFHIQCGSGSECVIQNIFNSSVKQYGISSQKSIIFILTAMNISVSQCFTC